MAQFNPFRPAYQEDPYPFLARLRAEEPIHRSRDLGSWVVTRCTDVMAILQDDEHFSSDPARSGGTLGEQVRGLRNITALGTVPLLGNSDPPVHTRLRAIVNRGFTPHVVDGFRTQIEDFIEAMQGTVQAGTPWDVMAVLAEALPVVVSLAFLGVPPDDLADFRARAAAILRIRSGETVADPVTLAQAQRAAFEMTGYLDSLRKDRDRVRADSVLTMLLQALDDEEDLTTDEVAMLLIHITSSGNGPTALAIGNAVLSLAEHPDQFQALHEDPGLAARAVEESLRFDSPTHIITRFATCAQDLGGRHIASGDTIHLVLGSANRDPVQFEDPDRFDLARADGRTFSFGHGIHFCLGAPLARLELEVTLSSLAARFAQIVVDRGRFERRNALLTRGPRRLVVTGLA
ncbi:MAG TPA: cytochrome P450 [Tepidiformaceae bacterium]